MTNVTTPFHEALKRKELMIPWCKSCGRPHFYPRFACPHCWAEDYDWQRAEGTGAIHSYTIVRANPPTAFSALTPYALAIIDLKEGVRILSNIVGDYRSLSIGDKVGVEFAERESKSIPVFRRMT